MPSPVSGSIERIDRARGSLVGLAVGDALGTTVEFRPRGTFEPLTGIVGGGPFNLVPGQWTDDTIMAICLAESLVACHGFEPVDQLYRYVQWWQEGHHSPKGHCFDIGATTARSLAEFRETGQPYREMNARNGGNGSLMRLAPIPIAYADLADVVRFAGQQSMTTHASSEAVAACQVYAIMIHRAIAGRDKEAILDPVAILAAPGLGDVPPAIAAIVAGSYRDKAEPSIRSDGYVVSSLEAALWAFHRTRSFAEGALLAVNLGHDADTTGAIYGQLAGSFYGLSGIDPAWRRVLHRGDFIVGLVGELLAEGLGGDPGARGSRQ